LTELILLNMKSLFTFLCCVVFLGMSAQTYHPLVDTVNLWSNFYNPCDQANPFSYYEKVTTDTTFGGYTWKKLVYGSGPSVYYWIPNGFLREEADKKVYYTDPYGSKTWFYYDFGLSLGDTVHPLDDDVSYVLDSVTSFELMTGEFRNRFVLRYIDPFGGTDTCYDYWIEGIGSMNGLMRPAMCGMVGDNPSLICFWTNDLLQYHNSNFTECYVITAIRDSGSGIRDLKVYPNPTSRMTNYELRIANSGYVNISLYTISGVEVANMVNRELPAGDHTFTVNAGAVSDGIYFYNLRLDGVIKASGKLIVIH